MKNRRARMCLQELFPTVVLNRINAVSFHYCCGFSSRCFLLAISEWRPTEIFFRDRRWGQKPLNAESPDRRSDAHRKRLRRPAQNPIALGSTAASVDNLVPSAKEVTFLTS